MPLYQFVRDHFYPLISLLSFDCRQICRIGLTCEFYLIFYVLAKDNKPFAIAHVSFISSDQTTLADGDHNLLVYSVSILTDLYARLGIATHIRYPLTLFSSFLQADA